MTTSTNPLCVSTWNLGGPQHFKWSEFYTGYVRAACDALDDLFENAESAPNNLSALKCFTSARRKLAGKLVHVGFDQKQVESTFTLWATARQEQSVVKALCLEQATDMFRQYSWGDRHFPHRPTWLNMDCDQGPAMFKCTGTGGGVPHFRRFEDAWIEYMFRQDPDGKLLKVMPPNKYRMNDPHNVLDPNDTQILAYLDLFYFDWCTTFFVHELDNAKFMSVEQFTMLRDNAIRVATPAVRQVHTTNMIAKLLSKNRAIAFQELSPHMAETLAARLVEWNVGGSLVLPTVKSEQMAALYVAHPVETPNIFRGIVPETSALSSRAVGATCRINGEYWTFVSVHCQPSHVEELMEYVELGCPHGHVVILGDFNTSRRELCKLGAKMRAHGFRSTWDAMEGVPNTVNNVRTKWFQTQLAKGGICNMKPKDHIFVRFDSFEDTCLYDASVVVDSDFAVHEAGEKLVLNLPSDHAVVTTTFLK